MDLRRIAANMTVDEIVQLLAQAQQSAQESLTLAGQVKKLNGAVEQLTQRVDERDRQLAEKERQLVWFRQQLFGARSERRILDKVSPDVQLWLGEQMLDVPEEPPAKSETVKSYERKQRRRPVAFVEEDSRLRFDESVPIEIVHVANPAVDSLKSSEYKTIGEKVTYRLAQRSSYVVLKYVQKTVKVSASDEVVRGAAPTAVIERSFADVSFLANLAVDKFCHHLPLHRQHKRLEQGGVYVDRSTLTRLVHRTAELLEPIYFALLSSVRLSDVLTMDESPTPAGLSDAEPGRPAHIKKGYFWALYGDKDEVAFLFSPSRGKSVIEHVLKGFHGTLLTDGYKAYESYVEQRGNIDHGQCWAHARRKFVDAEKFEPKKSAFVLGLLQQMYKVEDECRDQSHEARLEARRTLSKPIVNRLFEFFREQRDRALLLPSSPFLDAVEYALRRERQLHLFLENGSVPVDTNHLERQLRAPAVGRKNWMFHVTEVGARYAAIFYSLLRSCELCDVRPDVYLIDVLQRLDTHAADAVHLLTPRLWKENFADNPLRSDICLRP